MGRAAATDSVTIAPPEGSLPERGGDWDLDDRCSSSGPSGLNLGRPLGVFQGSLILPSGSQTVNLEKPPVLGRRPEAHS